MSLMRKTKTVMYSNSMPRTLMCVLTKLNLKKKGGKGSTIPKITLKKKKHGLSLVLKRSIIIKITLVNNSSYTVIWMLEFWNI